MSNWFCVNRSGSSIPVWDRAGFPADMGSVQIGTLYNDEAFGYDKNWGGDAGSNLIVFRKKSGEVGEGFVVNKSKDETLPAGWATNCMDFPYGTVTINGIDYKTFKFRRSEAIYRPDASHWGTVAANRRVACQTVNSGATHPQWKIIEYVENTNGEWIQVTGDGHSFGCVNTGLEHGSMPDTISMYGSINTAKAI